ncbi:MAG: glycosyltransferase family 2 protein [Bacteroidota bacterium]
MKNTPLVSIITVVFNGEKYLQQTIDSVYQQTYSNIEYIIIDGKSTDGTLDIIKANEDKISTWISEEDNGLYDAMNKGIGMAKGELIGIINSDDWYEKEAIRLVVDAYINNREKQVFHGDRFDITESGERRRYRFNPSKYKFLYYSMTYNHPSMFFHKEVYKRFKYSTTLKIYSDYELVLKLYLKQPETFYYISRTYVNYRLDGLSTQQSIYGNIKEGATSRLNAGLTWLHVLIFMSVKSSFLVFKKLIRLFSIK